MPITLPIGGFVPIAVNSEVTVLSTQVRRPFGRWEDSGVIIFDHHNGILYGPDWMPFDITPEDIVEGNFSRVDYRKKPSAPPFKARVLRCTVRGYGGLRISQLVLEPLDDPETPYRG